MIGATGELVTSLFNALKAGLHELGYVEGATSFSSSDMALAIWSGCRSLPPSWYASTWR